jgi:hypothetical protein
MHCTLSRRLVGVLFAFVFLTGSVATTQAQELSAEEKSAGFVSLFNGQDFTGWRFVSKGDDAKEAPNWLVKDGVIHLTGGGSPHLASAKEYGDFEMRFEWRSLKEKYNSGFYVRSSARLGNNQINLAKGAEGTLMYGKSKGGVGVPALQKPPGEWNEWRILVQGDKATFSCNGQQAWEATGLVPEKGYVGLQAEGAALEFRNLRIREVK